MGTFYFQKNRADETDRTKFRSLISSEFSHNRDNLSVSNDYTKVVVGSNTYQLVVTTLQPTALEIAGGSEALETGRPYRGYFNVRNNGCISNLPPDAVVEVPCYVDANGISVPRIGDLPLGCAAVCNASVSVQRLAVEAAVHGDVRLLKQAMLMDPLVGAVCTPPEASQMTDEMLIKQSSWLPQYSRALAAARKRFAAEPKLA